MLAAKPFRGILIAAVVFGMFIPKLSTGAEPDGLPKETKQQRDQRMAWWRDARFGMFIHWGLYAVPAGTWNGKQIDGIGEWIMNTGKIPVADYAEADREVQSREVRRRRMGENRQGRGHEVHRDHVEASRRLRHVPLEGEPLQHLRRHAVPSRPVGRTGRGLQEAGNPAGVLLFAGAGLASSRRGRLGRALGQSPGRRHDRISSQDRRSPGARDSQQLRARGGALVGHPLRHDEGAGRHAPAALEAAAGHHHQQPARRRLRRRHRIRPSRKSRPPAFPAAAIGKPA